jgi:hypothetical protein
MPDTQTELCHEEHTEINKLRYIVDNWDTVRIERWENAHFGSPLGTLAVCKDYIHMSKNNIVKTKYRQSKNQIGRFIAVKSRSLQCLPREIRHTISKKYYYDLDIVNAQPTLLVQYCEKNNIPCDHVRNYVDHREVRLQELMDVFGYDRETAKQAVLSLINRGGVLRSRMQDCPTWVKNFEMNMELIIKRIYELEPEISKMGIKNAKDKKKTKGYYNPDGSTINLLMCNLENMALMSMIKFLRARGIDTKRIVLVFDGLMLYKKSLDGIDLIQLCKDMADGVLADTGYQIIIKEKPMDQGLDVPEGYKSPENENIIEDDENEAADRFYEIIANDIRLCDNTYYVRKNGIWIHEPKQVERALLDRALRSNFIKRTKEGEKSNYSSKLSGAKNIVEATMIRVPEAPSFIRKMRSTNKLRLVFQNGYYDFSTKKFTEGFEGVDSVVQIDRPYPVKKDEKMIREVIDRVLIPIWGEGKKGCLSKLGTTYLHCLARAMAGHTEDKKFVVMMGERDCGKGVLGALVLCAFEKYIGTISPENLLVQRVGFGDEAKKLSWAVAMEHTRLVITNEIRLDEANGLKLDGNMVKKIAGDDEQLMVRTNYKDERAIRINATLLMCCNDLPAISPADAYQKIVPFICPNKFQEGLTEEEAKRYPFLKKADPSIKEFCSRPEVGDAFFHLVADHYQNHSVPLTEDMKKWKEQFSEEDEISILLRKFHITRNDKDKVRSADIQSFIKSQKINMTMASFKMFVERRGAHHGTFTVENKSFKGFSGMVMINDHNDLDN